MRFESRNKDLGSPIVLLPVLLLFSSINSSLFLMFPLYSFRFSPRLKGRSWVKVGAKGAQGTGDPPSHHYGSLQRIKRRNSNPTLVAIMDRSWTRAFLGAKAQPPESFFCFLEPSTALFYFFIFYFLLLFRLFSFCLLFLH